MVKKPYRNAVRSRILIRTAFVNLLQEKPFEKITATDVINRAGIHRSTFYDHYPDVRGIMDEIIDEVLLMFREMLNRIDFSRVFQDPQPFLEQVISFLEKNQELYRLLGKSEAASLQMQKLKQLLVQQVLELPNLQNADRYSVTITVRVRLLLGGVIDTYQDWLNGEISCSLEQLTYEVSQVINLLIME